MLVLVLVSVATLAVVRSDEDGQLVERWVSDTGQDTRYNHHPVAVGTVDGEPVIAVPVGVTRSSGNVSGCGLVALDGDGTARWRSSVPDDLCFIHAVGDPAFVDVDADGSPEVVVTTTENLLYAYDPLTGGEELRHELAAFGYAAPAALDSGEQNRRELLVVDSGGQLSAVASDGSVSWQRELAAWTVADPAVADFDGDGTDEVAVATTKETTVLDRDGRTVWRRPIPANWLTVGQLDDDAPVELVVAGNDRVTAVDGRTGGVEWRWTAGPDTGTGVHAVGDGDRDGTVEVYVTATDGRLYALDGRDGSVEWQTALKPGGVGVLPPPVLGDLDGDGGPELVAVTDDGTVSVLDPRTGEIRSVYVQDVPVWTHPTLADVDGDGGEEIFVMYGDGRVVALDYVS